MPVKRSREAIEQDLLEEIQRAQACYHRARDEFKEVIASIPGGLPQPDGSQRIVNCSRERAAAMQAYGDALTRLSDFQREGISGQWRTK